MINIFYKYCFDHSVLPKFYRIEKETNQKCYLELASSVVSMDELKQKYKTMSEIMEQKLIAMNATTEQLENDKLNKIKSKDDAKLLKIYNMVIVCCPNDTLSVHCLADRLIDEGYLVCIDDTNQLPLTTGANFEKTDLLLIYFSKEYSENADRMTQLKLIKASGKKIIPILVTK
ncbi:unnamed protein product, partial [Rotaria sordida]